MSDVDHEGLARHVVELARVNPAMARGLRDVIKDSLKDHEPNSEAHDHLLETMNNLDLMIASEGGGYAKHRVAPETRKDA